MVVVVVVVATVSKWAAHIPHAPSSPHLAITVAHRVHNVPARTHTHARAEFHLYDYASRMRRPANRLHLYKYIDVYGMHTQVSSSSSASVRARERADRPVHDLCMLRGSRMIAATTADTVVWTIPTADEKTNNIKYDKYVWPADTARTIAAKTGLPQPFISYYRIAGQILRRCPGLARGRLVPAVCGRHGSAVSSCSGRRHARVHTQIAI